MRLGQGQFVWLIGDDDIVCEGAVRDVISAIRANPRINCFFVNYCTQHADERTEVPEAGGGVTRHPWCAHLEDRIVERWEDIIGLYDGMNVFSYMGCCVVRREMWDRNVIDDQPDNPNLPFESIERTCLYVCAIARQVIGRPAMYLGKPHITVFWAHHEWHGYWSSSSSSATWDLPTG